MEAEASRAQHRGATRVFYGWRIVGVSMMCNAFASGLTSYAFGLFVKPLAAAFGASFREVALGMTLLGVAQTVYAPFLGKALDRYSLRGIITAGAGLMALGFGLMSIVPALWMAGVLFGGVVTLGMLALGTQGSPKVVANWFVRQRGQALGISMVGVSAGGLIAPPLTALAMEVLGWRGALVCFTLVLAMIAVPLTWLVIVNRPEDLGLMPDGEERAAETTASGAASVSLEWSFGSLLRERNFWVIAVSIGLCNAVMGGVVINLHPYATDLGIGGRSAAVLISCFSICGMGGKLIFGTLADRFDPRLGLSIAFLLVITYIGALLSHPSYGALMTVGVIGGLASGAGLPMWGAMVGRCYGRHAFGGVMGFMASIMGPLLWVVFPFMGWVHDRTGNYDSAFRVFIGAMTLASAVLLFLRPPRTEPGT